MARFEYRLTTEDEGKTLKAIVREQFAFSSRLRSKLRRGDLITVNGEILPSWIPLKKGDLVAVDLPEEQSQFPPENIPVYVVYEDKHLLVVNKQPGIVVHPTKGNPCHTLLNGLMYRMSARVGEGSGGSDTIGAEPYKIRLVNRLDMNTSGLIVIAKNAYVQADLMKQMKDGRMVKKYLALAEGIIPDNEGTIDLPLGKPDENEVERWVVPIEQGGQESVTHFKVMRRFIHPHEMTYGSAKACGPIEQKTIDGYTLVELKLDTGRTHQIRIHMAAIGHPVVGDHLYCHGDPFEYRRVYGDPRPPLTGEKGPRGETNPEIISDLIPRHALHAYSLDFVHPMTGERMHLETGLPEDMMTAVGNLSDDGEKDAEIAN